MSESKGRDKKCLTPGCNGITGIVNSAKGLCGTCYRAAKYQVMTGKVTWAELEELGLCLSIISGRKAKTGKFHAALDAARKHVK